MCTMCISQCKRTNCAQIHHWVRYVNWWSLRNHLEPYTALANYIHFPLELIYLCWGKRWFFLLLLLLFLDCTCAYMHSVCFILSKVLVNFWCINLILSIEVFIYWISCIHIKVQSSMLRDGSELDTYLSKNPFNQLTHVL